MTDWRVDQVHEPQAPDTKVEELAGFQAEVNEMARQGWIEFYQDESGVERVALTPSGRMRAQRTMREGR